MESHKIGTVYAVTVMDGTIHDALSFASLPDLAAEVSGRMESAKSPDDVMSIVRMVDRCDAMLDRLALSLPDEVA
jgi:hypothetical protein